MTSTDLSLAGKHDVVLASALPGPGEHGAVDVVVWHQVPGKKFLRSSKPLVTVNGPHHLWDDVVARAKAIKSELEAGTYTGKRTVRL